jgi:hypothetical protein
MANTDYEDNSRLPEEGIPDPFQYDPTGVFIIGIDSKALYDIASRTILGFFESVGEVTDEYIKTVVDRITDTALAALKIYQDELIINNKQLAEDNAAAKKAYEEARDRCREYFHKPIKIGPDGKVTDPGGKIPELRLKHNKLLAAKSFRTNALNFRKLQNPEGNPYQNRRRRV